MVEHEGLLTKLYSRRWEWYGSSHEWALLGIAFVVILVIVLIP